VEICNAYLRHPSHDVSEAARRLKIIFNTYGNIAKKPVKEQTSATVNILQELQGKYSADCAAIKIDDWVSLLATQNEVLNKLMTDRYDETAAKPHISIKIVRGKGDEVYKNICLLIESYILQEGIARYDVFVNTLNAIIAKCMEALHHHRHRHHHSESVQTEVGNV